MGRLSWIMLAGSVEPHDSQIEEGGKRVSQRDVMHDRDPPRPALKMKERGHKPRASRSWKRQANRHCPGVSRKKHCPADSLTGAQ